MKNYTLGFIFSEDEKYVILIRKKNNKFGHLNKWNGLGGGFEESDSNLYDSFRRKVIEESGLYLTNGSKYAELRIRDNDIHIHVFKAYAIFPKDYEYDTDEGFVQAVKIDEVKNLNTIQNVKWLIEMALDKDEDLKMGVIHYG